MTAVSELNVQISPGADDDEEEVDRLTRQVRDELLELDVEDVRPKYVAAPANSKSGLAELAGWLTVTLTPEMLQAVVTTLGNLATRTGRSITMQFGDDSLHITGASRAQTQQAMDEFLARHPVPGAPHSQ